MRPWAVNVLYIYEVKHLKNVKFHFTVIDGNSRLNIAITGQFINPDEGKSDFEFPIECNNYYKWGKNFTLYKV